MGLNLNPLDAAKDAFKAVGDVASKGADSFSDAVGAAKSAISHMSAADMGHAALDGVGLIPVVGDAADLANGAWYAAEGDWANAAISGAAAVPFIGDAATAAKWGKRGIEAAKDVSHLAKDADHAVDAVKTIDRTAEGASKAEKTAARAEKKGAKAEEETAAKSAGALRTIERTQGKNKMTWDVDSEGRFVSGKAELSEDFAGKKTRGQAEKKAQKAAAGRGEPGDQGGHMFAHRFVKDQGDVNLVPQNGDLNNNAWGQMEQEWGDWIKAEKKVDVDIVASPAGKDRPDRFRVNYEVKDPETGKTIFKKSQPFENEAGQTFDRVKARDMAKYG